MTEKNTPQFISNSLKSLFINVLLPLILGIILFIIEYWSGWFVQIDNAQSSAVSLFWLQVLILLLFITTLLLFNCFRIWLKPAQHFREDYALTSLFAFAFSTLTLGVMLTTQIAPWTIHYLIPTFFKQQVSVIPLGFADNILLIVIWIAIYWSITQGHKNWHGQKSFNQYTREQEGDSINVLLEGALELWRILKRHPPLKAYQASNYNPNQPLLQGVTEPEFLAWKDQALELIQLSSSAYVFDSHNPETWHDKGSYGYWIGHNLNTNQLVALYPLQTYTDDKPLRAFERYVKDYAATHQKKIAELIVVFKDNCNLPTSPLLNTLRFETESSLLDQLLNLNDYKNEIIRRVAHAPLDDSTLTLNDVYVPSAYFLDEEDAEAPKETPHDDIEAYLRAWLKEPGQRQLALLGDYGQGKSTTSLLLTYHLLTETDGIPPRIPILIELRGRSPRNQNRLGLLGDWAAQYSLNPRALERLLMAGRLLIIFEGFDEMALVGDADLRLKHFQTLWQFAYPQAKILITGRPNFFLDNKELKQALGIQQQIGNQPYCQAIRLAPFELPQIQQTLRNHPPIVREQISQKVAESPHFKDIVARPSILHIVAVLWEKENLVDKISTLTAASVMAAFIQRSYRRQGLKEKETPKVMALTTREREYFMRGIATYMAANQLPNQINSHQLNQAIETLLETIPDEISTASLPIHGESKKPLRFRIADTKYGRDQVKTDVRACGLLVDDPSTPDTFRFGHKSFMEFLFADVLAGYINEDKKMYDQVVMKATKAKIMDIAELPVSVIFFAELVKANLADYLAKEKPTIESERLRVEQRFATQLLKAILDINKLLFMFQRVSLYDATLAYSAKHWPIYKRIFIILLSFSSIVGLFSLLLGLLIISISSLSYLTLLLYLLLGVLLSALTEFIKNLFNKNSVFRKEKISIGKSFIKTPFGLWSYLCKKAGIQDQTLHRVAGTWWLPWAKNQPFDYFLPESDKGDKERKRK